jgi:hypothetical protein
MLSSFVFKTLRGGSINGNVESAAEANIPQVIQANILNGCGVTGLAGDVKHYLRARGFDIVEIGNYEEIQDKSIIVDRIGDMESAKKLALAMGISDSLIVTKIDSSLFLRASVVIGKDYNTLAPFN